MQKIIPITHEESQIVYKLFSTYTAYTNVLSFLATKTTLDNTEIFDKKWDEAVLLCSSLEEAKRKIEKKYKPEGSWDRFEFNFEEDTVIFTKDET